MMKKCEPLDLVEASFIGLGSVGLYATMFFDGRIDAERLADAAIRVGSIVPETLCRVDVKHMRYRPASSLDIVSEISEPVGVGFRWDPKTETQVKILVGHGEYADSMIIGLTHVVVDGIGLIQYVSLLADAYNGVLPNVHNVRSLAPILKGKTVGEPTEGEKLAAALGDQSILLPHVGMERSLRRVVIPADTMSAIHDAARGKGVTLNDVFIAACVRVVSRLRDWPVVIMPCPVDLRKFGDVGPLSVANMSGMYRSSYRVDPGDSFSRTVDLVHREISEMAARNRSMDGLATFCSLCRWVPLKILALISLKSFSVPPIIYSNWGTLAPLSFGQSHAVTYFTNAPYRPNYQISLTISSYDGATSFVHALRGDEEAADAGEDVLRQIAAECELLLTE